MGWCWLGLVLVEIAIGWLIGWLVGVDWLVLVPGHLPWDVGFAEILGNVPNSGAS